MARLEFRSAIRTVGFLASFSSLILAIIRLTGAGAVIGFFLAGWMGAIDPRATMSLGYVLWAWTGWVMWGFNAEAAALDVLIVSIVQGVCVGIIWAPMTVSAFSRVEPHHFSETSAIYHLLRNIGSSVFISLSVTTVIRTQTMNYGHLREFITPFNEAFLNFSTVTGVRLDRTEDMARLNEMATDQAQLAGFLNSFGLYTAVCLAALPLIWMIRPPDRHA